MLRRTVSTPSKRPCKVFDLSGRTATSKLFRFRRCLQFSTRYALFSFGWPRLPLAPVSSVSSRLPCPQSVSVRGLVAPPRHVGQEPGVPLVMMPCLASARAVALRRTPGKDKPVIPLGVWAPTSIEAAPPIRRGPRENSLQFLAFAWLSSPRESTEASCAVGVSLRRTDGEGLVSGALRVQRRRHRV